MVSEGVEAQQAEVFWPIGDEDACLRWLWQLLRSPDGQTAVCPRCRKTRRFHRISTRRSYACDRCGLQIYPTVGTFLENSHIGLTTWFRAVALLRERGGEGPASRLADELAVSQPTALRMRRKLRDAEAHEGQDRLLLTRLAHEIDRSPPQFGHGRRDEGATSPTVERIKAAACRTIAVRGIGATRVADIAVQAGVSSANIHYHFRTKDALLLAALGWAEQQLQRRVTVLREAGLDSRQLLEGVLGLGLPGEDLPRADYLLWRELWTRVESQPELLLQGTAIADWWPSLVVEVIETGVAEGHFRPVDSPREVALRLTIFTEGLCNRCTIGWDGMTPTRARGFLSRFAAQQLGVETAALSATP